jgi:hypothetical protein
VEQELLKEIKEDTRALREQVRQLELQMARLDGRDYSWHIKALWAAMLAISGLGSYFKLKQ